MAAAQRRQEKKTASLTTAENSSRKSSESSDGRRKSSGSWSSSWMAESESKRWAEMFFLCYSPVWITWALGIVVPFGLYERFDELGYMVVGLAAALPCILVPLFIVGRADRQKPLWQRHWLKANVWIAIFSFVGNYFWTHYFYSLLGASYTFPSWRLNNVPIPLYLLTHAYFCFYHTLSNLSLRRCLRLFSPKRRGLGLVVGAAWVLVFAYFTAFMETLTISQFKYYTFVDKGAMYRVGSLFYAIYFFVSFPMFFRVEEKAHEEWSLTRVAVDSLGAAMAVTILLDFWRIFIGPIINISQSLAGGASLMWF